MSTDVDERYQEAVEQRELNLRDFDRLSSQVQPLRDEMRWRVAVLKNLAALNLQLNTAIKKEDVYELDEVVDTAVDAALHLATEWENSSIFNSDF